MKRFVRPLAALLLVAITAFAVAACGGSSSKSTSASGGSGGGSATTTSSGGSSSSGPTQTIHMVQGTFPQSLDPGKDYTTQGSEVNWIVYTGLVTYAHQSGKAGGTLIPGLATALPKISDGGKTYTATLRKGLVYSNGAPVKASDFVRSVERAVHIPWGGSGAFITPIIQGAAAYSTGKSKTISGIQANDKTGKIVIHLTKPYGPFDNVLAFPCLGLVPSSTPLAVQANNPPPGVGPYKVTSITPGQSYDVVKNPKWKPIPGIPSGHVNVDVKISANVSSNALSVLNNTADVFDWADTIPGSLLPQIKSKASDRFANVNLGGSTYYIFFNVTKPPFNNQLVREAVVTGLNQVAMNKLSSGTLVPACFFLPPGVPGHPTGPCPYGNPASGGNIAKAKQLIKQSGMAGTKVTVWSETRAPRQQWMTYYNSFLNQIGLKSSIKVIADANYFTTIGSSKSVNPQTGFADWNQDFPNPIDFYLLVDGKAIQPTDNENFGQTNDPKINAAIAKLGKVPTTQIKGNVVKQWQAIDEYTAKKAYLGVFGYQTFPFFMSDRMNFTAAIHQPIYGWDFTSFQLK
ncbi:MAG TPA: ABC transporter substrate-binding protein [Solirubrobacteraceae bacterium]|nr:ABC transporter substrate-binding protein [Solirubrobacteraceae bacterium]